MGALGLGQGSDLHARPRGEEGSEFCQPLSDGLCSESGGKKKGQATDFGHVTSSGR